MKLSAESRHIDDVEIIKSENLDIVVATIAE